MQNSQLNTMNVPASGSASPGTLFKAADIPIRIVITNVGPALIFLAHDTATLTNTPVSANAYQLTVTQSVVLVLAPHQGVYAAALGLGGVVSVAMSEALPVT
jgi:hypothetical protein